MTRSSKQVKRAIPKKTIAVDIDDVLAASAEAFVKFSNERWGTHLEVDDYHEDWAQMWQVDRAEELERAKVVYHSGMIKGFRPHHPSAGTVLRELTKRFRLIIVTSRASALRDGTVEWIEKHYPGLFEEVHMTGFYDTFMDEEFKDDRMHKRTKGEMLSQLGADYLIDDQPKHCLAAAELEIEAVLFGDYRWNHDLKTLPDSVTRCVDWLEVEQYFASRR